MNINPIVGVAQEPDTTFLIVSSLSIYLWWLRRVEVCQFQSFIFSVDGGFFYRF